mgnify:CR=1 FL=1
MKRIRLLVLLCGMLALTACALPSRIPLNTTSADELQRRMGKPTEILPNPAGGEYWYYIYGPAGFETWRFGIDGTRVVRSSDQLIAYEHLHKVKVGVSTEKDVRMLLGKPATIMQLRSGPSWEWRANLQSATGYFVVTFDRNGVASSTAVIPDFFADGDRGSP